jgi:hypothetical protein
VNLRRIRVEFGTLAKQRIQLLARLSCCISHDIHCAHLEVLVEPADRFRFRFRARSLSIGRGRVIPSLYTAHIVPLQLGDTEANPKQEHTECKAPIGDACFYMGILALLTLTTLLQTEPPCKITHVKLPLTTLLTALPASKTKQV